MAKKPARKTAPPTDAFHEDLSRDTWEYEPASPSLVMRMIAEACGTFVLVLVVLGAALYAPVMGNPMIVVAFAFGIAMMGALVAIGRVSGAHINPAITVALWVAGRFPGKDVAPYIVAQVVGGIAASAATLALITSSPQVATPTGVMAGVSNGYGDQTMLGFPLVTALGVELLATALLAAVFLAATSVKAVKAHAPFALGLGATIVVSWALPFTNAGLNPARSTASALFADGAAIGQLWVFWLAPVVGAALVGLLYRAFGPEEDFAVVALRDIRES